MYLKDNSPDEYTNNHLLDNIGDHMSNHYNNLYKNENAKEEDGPMEEYKENNLSNIYFYIGHNPNY
ncbi:hypothetical protein [Dethiothermospora halolimnae]|uniref:hypothetical protein n=1 Tax=Dethiothermospora halolimnae TaxID=3114390 RepID=UPI003CCB85A6